MGKSQGNDWKNWVDVETFGDRSDYDWMRNQMDVEMSVAAEVICGEANVECLGTAVEMAAEFGGRQGNLW